MRVSGWSNGSPNNMTGSGYGLRLSKKDRDQYFNPSWSSVIINLHDLGPVKVELTESFWKNCTELRNPKIGLLMVQHGHAPWMKGKPPEYRLIPSTDRYFDLVI